MKTLLLLLICSLLQAKTIETFYGSCTIEEPVLLELIEHPAFQRLKFIHQYGVAYYTTHKEEFSRYDHSLGVFMVLRKQGQSLEGQIAGLLHDVSHTIFSHVGDWVFAKAHEEKDYQNSIHPAFLKESGLAEVLERHGLKVEDILPTETLFPALERPGPELCADRIDYNIQGAYYQNFLTKKEALEIFEDLCFVGGDWISFRPDLMRKMALFTLFMTQDCWGSPTNDLASTYLAESLLRGIEIGLLSWNELHFGQDDIIWHRLTLSEDPFIAGRMQDIFRVPQSYELVPSFLADRTIKAKFRGIDPWIATQEGKVRLTVYDPLFAEEYQKAKQKMSDGWSIRFVQRDERL